MIQIELRGSPSDPQRIIASVRADRGEQLLYVEGPRDVVLAGLIEWLRGLTVRRVGQ